MDVNLSAALSSVGIPDIRILPATVHCPLCNVPTLEVSGQNRIVCRTCWFIGDAIQLVAKARKTTVEQALDTLAQTGAATFNEGEKKAYLTKLAELAPVTAYHAESQKWFREMPSSLRVVLQHYGGQLTDGEAQRLLPHITLIRPDALKEILSPSARKLLQAVGNYTGLGIACWSDARIVGYWICTINTQIYLPLATEAGVGGALTVGALAQSAVITDDPTTALSLLLRSVKSQTAPAGVLLPVGDVVRWTPARERIYWSSQNKLRWLRLALRDLGAKAVLHKDVSYEWDKVHYGTVSRFLAHLTEQASPPSEAIGRLLLSAPVQNARGLLSEAPLTVPEQAEILSRFSSSEQDDLRAIFDAHAPERAIEWRGKRIVENQQGWTCGSTIISEAIMRLEQIRVPDRAEDATVTGTITYQRHTFRFEEKLMKLRKNAGAWLHAFVLRNAGASCIVGSGWGSQLFDIAQQFHKPVSSLPGDRAGWDAGALRLPCFEISERGIMPASQHVAGPLIPVPSQPSVADLEGMHNVATCQLFLALLGNLVAPIQNRPYVKIGLVGAAVALTKLEAVLKRKVYNDETAERLLELGQHPIPTLATPTPHILSGLVEGEPSNLIVTVDRHTMALLRTRKDWLTLNVADAQVRGFESLFFAAAAAIAAPVQPATKYRDLAKVSAQTLSAFGVKHAKFDSAARELDSQANLGPADVALHLIRYGVAQGAITPVVTDTGVTIKQAQFRAATSSGIVRMPHLSEVTEALTAARYLLPSPRGEWSIHPDVWSLYSSLVPVTAP
jgi:hypothetical protein